MQAHKRALDIVGGDQKHPEFQKFFQESYENPTSAMITEAQNAADVNIFTNTPKSELLKKATELSKANSFTRLTLPFIKTNVNIMIENLDRIPVLSLIFKDNRAAIMGELGEDAYNKVLAKWTVGASVGATAVGLSYSGVLTGNGPINPAARKFATDEMGFQPNSVLIGDSYVSISSTNPFMRMMGVVADMTHAMNNTSDEQIFGTLSSLVTGIGTLLDPDALTQNMSELVDAIQSRDPGKYARIMAKQAEGFIPQAFRKASRGLDAIPGLETEGNIKKSTVTQRKTAKDGEILKSIDGVQSAFDKIKQNIPFFSDDMEPRLNIFGEEITWSYSAGTALASIILPGNIKKAATDPVTRELVELDILQENKGEDTDRTLALRPLSKSFQFTDIYGTPGPQGKAKRMSIPLNPKQYNELIRSTNDPYPGAMPTMRERLAEVIKDYEPAAGDIDGLELTDDDKRNAILEVYANYRELGRSVFETNNQDFIMNQKHIKGQKLMNKQYNNKVEIR
jgi:hypothetical protein